MTTAAAADAALSLANTHRSLRIGCQGFILQSPVLEKFKKYQLRFSPLGRVRSDRVLQRGLSTACLVSAERSLTLLSPRHTSQTVHEFG